MYPDFLIIGAQKAGTTWLYKNLSKHPEIWFPPIKELHYFNYKQNNWLQTRSSKFFDKHWQRIIGEQLNSNFKQPDFKNILWNFKFFLEKRNDIWYGELFDNSEGKLAGEATPDYSILSEASVNQIYGLMPKSKIIFIMRNPIDRAWSHATMFFKLKEGRAISTVPEEEIVDLCLSQHSRLRGDYMRTVNTWSKEFPKEQFFVGFFEDIQTNPVGLLTSVLEFLNLNVPEDFFKQVELGKIFSFGNDGKVPERVKLELAKLYYEDIKKLNSIYGSYTKRWLESASNILENCQSGQIY
jgi:hypothetical protein